MSGYNYDEFSPDDYDFDTVEGPSVGQKAPDFKLTTSDGRSQRLLNFQGDFLVLEMGSITCPLFQSRRGIMQSLEKIFPQASSAVLYVREAHPGVHIQGHKNFDDKLACATQLKTEDNETRTIFVDDFDGGAHQAYGSMPNAVFIIDKLGCVRFHSEWNNPSATRKALKALIAGKPVRAKSYFRPALPPVVLKTLGRAGEGSASDFFRGLPFLIWTNLVKRNLRILFGKKPKVDHSQGC